MHRCPSCRSTIAHVPRCPECGLELDLIEAELHRLQAGAQHKVRFRWPFRALGEMSRGARRQVVDVIRRSLRP